MAFLKLCCESKTGSQFLFIFNKKIITPFMLLFFQKNVTENFLQYPTNCKNFLLENKILQMKIVLQLHIKIN